MGKLVRVVQFVALLTFAAAAQKVNRQTGTAPPGVAPLAPPNATLAEEFFRLISVRELPDGRVLLTDDKENRLAVGDLRANKVRTLGRSGDGPGEYRVVGRLWDAGGDTTFMSVPYRRRWLVMRGDSIVQTITGDHPVMALAGNDVIRGADAHGNVLTVGFPAPKRPGVMPDSMPVLRINRTSLRVDTLAQIAAPNMQAEAVRPASAGSSANPAKRTYVIRLAASEQLAMFPNGTAVVVRGSPYRVDWCASFSKSCGRGTPLVYSALPMRGDDKSTYLRVINRLSLHPPTTNVDEVVGWPSVIPAFATPGGPDEATVWTTAGGNIVIERIPTAGMASLTYDVINARSQTVARISVPAGHRILGFGAKSAYTVNVDDDGIQKLQRHPWAY